MEYYLVLGFLAVVAAYPGIIHDEGHHEEYEHHAPVSESGHHHQVEHEHAKSHQSIKFEHFHAVPVYVKKEHSHLLKHPLEKGKSEQKLKLVHPKTEHSHGDGLVLEDERHHTEHGHHELGHHELEHHEHEHEHHEGGQERGGFEHGGFEHHHGFEGYGGGEELKGFDDHHEHESESHHFEHGHSFGGDGGEGYIFEGY